MQIFMNDAAFLKNGFKISTDKDLLVFDVIYRYLAKDSYWAKGMPEAKLKTAIENSLCFGVYKNDMQAGFARVITDNATFAYIADVFILSVYRKNGLSKWLIQTILNHPDLQGMRKWVLATADAQGLYGQFGFAPINNPERWMDIYTPYIID